MRKFALSLLFGLLAMASVDAIRHQAIAVHGKLRCGDAPANNVRIKLFDEDSGPDPDDVLDQGYTDSNGEFRLKGTTTELTGIDVVFKVYHDCDDGLKPGSRKVKFKIPNTYVTEGTVAKKTFELGEINLETVFAEEERELIVSKKKRNILDQRFNLFSHF
ncbi:transthyretin-like family domain-containing protein [Ditylenchus destructor]|nr:transthyretin-like family domain-containing protein [Ditylenchus destructor]